MKRLLLSLCFALPVGCVLLVEDVDTFGETCTIQGSQTVCGQCLVANCQGPINFCCGDPNCDATRIDQCALGNCTAVNQASVWESCAFSACGSQCGLTGVDGGLDGSSDGASDATIDVANDAKDSSSPPVVTNCTTDFNSCSCTVGGPSNTTVCDRTTINNGFCCADATWPASGNCRCKTLFCEVNSFGCECGLVQSGSMGSCQPTASLPNCCAMPSFGTCVCNKKICESWVGDSVAECTALTMPCPNNGKPVTSCSF